MNRILLSLVILSSLFISNSLLAQTNNVGIGTPTPDASSVLELKSANQGFLVPRMDSTTRNAIPSPASGLMIYDTDIKCFEFYTGTNWQSLCSGGFSPSGWQLPGNAGTTAGTNFIGTTDAQDMVMKANNTEVLRATQTGAVGINQPAPNANAILDIQSTTKGVLIPRMNTGNRNAIATPVNGLMIFNTDSNCFEYYNTTFWQDICGGKSKDAWLLTGNSGTTAGTNYVGTNDPQDLVLKTNNTEVVRVTQSGSVGINQATPNATAILDISSVTKGVLFPSFTTAQRNAIAAPALGLTIYNNTINVHQFWNGVCWVNVGQTVCSFDYTLSISHPSDCILKTNFNSVSDTLTIALVSGTASPVTLSAAGVPAGILANFSNNYLTPTQTSVMTLTALPSAVNGTYTITVLATSGSTVRTVTYTLIIYDFGVSLTSLLDTVNELGIAPNRITATTTVNIGNASSCAPSASTALLSYNNLPVGISASFTNSNIAIPGSTTLTFTSSSCAVPGTYNNIQVIATIGTVSQVTTYTLVVAPSIIHITNSLQNLNLFTYVGSPSCPVDVTFNIDTLLTIGSASTAQAALQTGAFPGSPGPTGSHIVINNKASIIGAGGNGGDNNGHNGTTCPSKDGLAGGNAVDIGCSNVVLNNFGVIGGGGGGGGAGEELGVANPCTSSRRGSGGGGGAGSIAGLGGTATVCTNGSNGTLLTGGGGGAGNACSVSCTIVIVSFGPYWPGDGGAGGNLGQPGANGTSSHGFIDFNACALGNGGAAGCAIKANGNGYVVNLTPVVGPVCP